MSVLSKLNISPQMRLDTSAILGLESFSAFDFRALVSSFVGSGSSYILRGLSVTGRSGLSINISADDCVIFNPEDNNGSFYYGLPTDPDIIVSLPANASNIYVEATFTNATTNPINIGEWDPLATNNNQQSGTEFTTTADFEEYLKLNISVNTVGFSAGAVPLLKASTSSSAITAMEDARELFFRLGTGGTTPNSLNKFNWSTSRGEPSPSGVAVGESPGSPWQSKDSTGIINDKGITTLKQWLDAIMTRISEITGSALWYQSGASVAPATNVSLNQVFFDTLGHSIQPSKTATFKWKESGGGYVLAGEGQVAGSVPYTTGLVSWKGIYSNLEWELGDTFQSVSSRLYNSVRFTSPLVPDGSSLFLLLEREVSKGSGSNVAWSSNASYPTYPANQTISGVTGDFTGIAIGDYVRKQSQGYTKYYQVTQFYNGTTSVSTQGQIADSSVVALLLSTTIDAVSTEPLAFFRSRYSSADLFVGSAGSITDANYYWLGTNKGNLFYLRGFGTMQDGEEIAIIDDTYSHGNTSGASGLLIDHAPNAVYDPTNGYSLSSGSGTLVTLYRYARDNTVERPTPGSDNSGAMLTYTITAPVGLLTPGDSLWVRLSDTTGGALSNGPVTNTTDDLNNTDVFTNRWEVRPASTTPAKTFDDKDIFWVAKYVLQGTTPTLIFNDGSALDSFGQYVPGNFSIAGALKLDTTPTTSVLFIDPSAPGVVTSDSTNFNYNKTTGKLTVGNITVSGNTVDVSPAGNASLFPSAGSSTITVGGANSTTYIPGSLVVTGAYSAENVQQLQVADKLISLGVGDAANGGFGGGIEVADDTRTASSFASTNGSRLVTLTFGSSIATGYAVGDVIGVSATSAVGGVTAGQIGGQYTIQSTTPTAVNQAQLTSSTTLLIYSMGTATSTATSTTTPPSIFKGRWSITVTDSSGSPTGITSWGFASKQTTTIPTITPYSSYGIVPTANTTDMVRTRVPFVNADGQGPSGTDTTLDFSSVFTYNSSTGVLTAPALSTAYQDWQQQSGFLTPPSATYTRVFADTDNFLYTRTPDGNISNISEKNSNVYDESVDVVSSPSGNNQMAPISSPPTTVTLPLDSRKHIGTGLIASTTNTSATVTVKKQSHGLTSGQTVVISTATAIGGISSSNLSVTTTLTVVDANTFSFTAGASASASTTGYLDNVTAVSTRYYLVGDGTLEVYLNDILQRKGVDYNEVGALNNPSNSVSFLVKIVLNDTVRYRIDNNGGMVVYSSAGGGGTSLQGAYNAGATITTTTANPLTINGPSTEKIFVVNGSATITGLLDPAGVTLTPQSSSPIPSGMTGLWADASNNLVYTRNGMPTQNISQAVATAGASATSQVTNNTGSTIAVGMPVAIDSSGNLQLVNPSTEASAMSAVGVTASAINNGASGAIITGGELQSLITSLAYGTPIYVNSDGTLTDTKPDLSTPGFAVGSFIIRVGVLKRNPTTGLKDLVVNVQVVGQL